MLHQFLRDDSCQRISPGLFKLGFTSRTFKIAIPLYLDRRETVQPKIEQLSPGISKHISRETLCLLLKSIRDVLEHTTTAPYLNYHARRKLGKQNFRDKGIKQYAIVYLFSYDYVQNQSSRKKETNYIERNVNIINNLKNIKHQILFMVYNNYKLLFLSHWVENSQFLRIMLTRKNLHFLRSKSAWNIGISQPA